MGHNHDHSHDVTNINYNKRFMYGILLNLFYVAVEAVYGIMYDSLALVADASHNLSDVLGLVIAWGASYLVKKEATKQLTYGYKKSSILASLLNALILLVAIGGIAWEAIERFNSPVEQQGMTVIIVASIGVVINTLTALLFIQGKKDDLNIKGAYLHMVADAAISVGVVITGVLLIFTDWTWLDSAVSIVIVVVIFIGTWNLLKDSLHLALDAVPKNINVDDVSAYLKSLNKVDDVHDLHIWALSTTHNALTVHLVVSENELDDKFINEVDHELKHRFKISHTTIQIEKTDCKQNCC